MDSSTNVSAPVHSNAKRNVLLILIVLVAIAAIAWVVMNHNASVQAEKAAAEAARRAAIVAEVNAGAGSTLSPKEKAKIIQQVQKGQSTTSLPTDAEKAAIIKSLGQN